MARRAEDVEAGEVDTWVAPDWVARSLERSEGQVRRGQTTPYSVVRPMLERWIREAAEEARARAAAGLTDEEV